MFAKVSIESLGIFIPSLVRVPWSSSEKIIQEKVANDVHSSLPQTNKRSKTEILQTNNQIQNFKGKKQKLKERDENG